jgi:hypothetical protein
MGFAQLIFFETLILALAFVLACHAKVSEPGQVLGLEIRPRWPPEIRPEMPTMPG